jgi:Cu2+-containing amine oxidase
MGELRFLDIGSTPQYHVFSQLQAAEIEKVKILINRLWPEGTKFQYKVLTLQEPDKDEALAYLEAEHSGGPLPAVERRAWVNYYIRNTVRRLAIKERLLMKVEQIPRGNCQSYH